MPQGFLVVEGYLMYYAVVDELPFSGCTAAADTLAAGFVDEDEEAFF